MKTSITYNAICLTCFYWKNSKVADFISHFCYFQQNLRYFRETIYGTRQLKFFHSFVRRKNYSARPTFSLILDFLRNLGDFQTNLNSKTKHMYSTIYSRHWNTIFLKVLGYLIILIFEISCKSNRIKKYFNCIK